MIFSCVRSSTSNIPVPQPLSLRLLIDAPQILSTAEASWIVNMIDPVLRSPSSEGERELAIQLISSLMQWKRWDVLQSVFLALPMTLHRFLGFTETDPRLKQIIATLEPMEAPFEVVYACLSALPATEVDCCDDLIRLGGERYTTDETCALIVLMNQRLESLPAFGEGLEDFKRYHSFLLLNEGLIARCVLQPWFTQEIFDQAIESFIDSYSHPTVQFYDTHRSIQFQQFITSISRLRPDIQLGKACCALFKQGIDCYHLDDFPAEAFESGVLEPCLQLLHLQDQSVVQQFLATLKGIDAHYYLAFHSDVLLDWVIEQDHTLDCFYAFNQSCHADGKLACRLVHNKRCHEPGRHYLLTALQQKQKTLARLLVNQGIGLDEVDAEGMTPLHEAVRLKQLSLCYLLLEKSPQSINVQDVYGNTPLHQAVEEFCALPSGKQKIKKFIDLGQVDWQLRGEEGESHFELILEYGLEDCLPRDLSVIEDLRTSNYLLRVLDKVIEPLDMLWNADDGRSHAHLRAEERAVQEVFLASYGAIAHRLIEAGCLFTGEKNKAVLLSLMGKREEGDRLFLAMINRQPELVVWLDVLINVIRTGRASLIEASLAVVNAHQLGYALVKIFKDGWQEEEYKLLADRINWKIPNPSNGWTSLQHAIERKNSAFIRFYLRHFHDRRVPLTGKTTSPLLFAIQRRKLSAVKVFVESFLAQGELEMLRARLECVNETVLHVAARDPDIFLYLLKTLPQNLLDQIINAQDAMGNTATLLFCKGVNHLSPDPRVVLDTLHVKGADFFIPNEEGDLPLCCISQHRQMLTFFSTIADRCLLSKWSVFQSDQVLKEIVGWLERSPSIIGEFYLQAGGNPYELAFLFALAFRERVPYVQLPGSISMRDRRRHFIDYYQRYSMLVPPLTLSTRSSALGLEINPGHLEIMRTLESRLPVDLGSVQLAELLNIFDHVVPEDCVCPTKLNGEVFTRGELRGLLNTLIMRITDQVVYIGTPPAGTGALTVFYAQKKKLLQQLIYLFKKVGPLDNKDVREILRGHVLQLAEASELCATRTFDELLMRRNELLTADQPLTPREQIHLALYRKRLEWFSQQVPRGDVHAHHALLYYLGAEFGLISSEALPQDPTKNPLTAQEIDRMRQGMQLGCDPVAIILSSKPYQSEGYFAELMRAKGEGALEDVLEENYRNYKASSVIELLIEQGVIRDMAPDKLPQFAPAHSEEQLFVALCMRALNGSDIVDIEERIQAIVPGSDSKSVLHYVNQLTLGQILQMNVQTFLQALRGCVPKSTREGGEGEVPAAKKMRTDGFSPSTRVDLVDEGEEPGSKRVKTEQSS